MSNLEIATVPTFEKAESSVKAFIKLEGFAVRVNRTYKSKAGELRKIWIGCVHSGCYKKKGTSMRNTSILKQAVNDWLSWNASCNNLVCS